MVGLPVMDVPEISDELIRPVAHLLWKYRGQPFSDPWRDWYRAINVIKGLMAAEEISALEASRRLEMKQFCGSSPYSSGTSRRNLSIHSPVLSRIGGTPKVGVRQFFKFVAKVFGSSGEATPWGSGPSLLLPELRNSDMPLPPLPVESFRALDLIPRGVALQFRVLPLGGEPPVHDDQGDECGHIILLCEKKLTMEEREALMFMIPRFCIKYVNPGHPNYEKNLPLVENMEGLLAYYYGPHATSPFNQKTSTGPRQPGDP